MKDSTDDFVGQVALYGMIAFVCTLAISLAITLVVNIM
jgi:hypothetical protein